MDRRDACPTKLRVQLAAARARASSRAMQKRVAFPKPSARWIALILLGVLLLALSARGADFTAWQYAQPFDVAQPGLVRLELPPATLDAARADLADLRLAGPDGAEVPYLIVQARPARVTTRRAEDFRVELLRELTQITFTTGLTQALGRVTLETPARAFIKSVSVEGSMDGQRWETLVRNAQVFRESSGASQLAVDLPPRPWRLLRMRVDDSGSPPVPFTGAEVRAAEPDTAPLHPVPIVITERVENGSETRLTLSLGAAHLRLATLRLEATDPLFRREIALATRELRDDIIQERVLARGTVSRAPNAPATDSELKLDLLTPERSLLLLIENADAPPLQIVAVRAERRPVELLFFATQPGRHTLYIGNRASAAPRYNLPAQITAPPDAILSANTLPNPQANEQFRAPEALPDVTGVGAPLDARAWKYRKPVEFGGGDVLQLALDLETLAQAKSGLGDLRLLRAGQQAPFVIERTTLRQRVNPIARPLPDARRPSVSRWELKLPVAAAPVVELACQSPAPLFERDAVLLEMATDERGNEFRRELGRARWQRVPGQSAATLTLAIRAPPQTETLLLELDNGDNPAIGLGGFEFASPVTRLLFKAPAPDGVFLYYGNPEANLPQYDLRLAAAQLLAADRTPAILGSRQVLRGDSWAEALGGGKAHWLLWVVLTGVVLALLAVIARLLPKATP